LVRAVAGQDPDLKMPPDGNPALSKEHVETLRAWVAAGAKWGTDAAATSITKATHWSFQPIVRPTAPQAPGGHPIRAFVPARLERDGLRPSPPASRTTLIRRLSFDLVGLPPTPEEVAAFETDTSSDAYEKLVDRLLASLHFGERWGRHWLDGARYADSDGYE